jgi:integrase
MSHGFNPLQMLILHKPRTRYGVLFLAGMLPIDDSAFIKIRKRILIGCGEDTENCRSPYQLRHTGISLALNRRADPYQLAEQTGHDKWVMLSTYSHAINQNCLMVDIPMN